MFKSFHANLVLIILMSASLPVILFSGYLVSKIHHNTREAALKELNLKVTHISSALRYEMDLIASGLQSLGINRDIALATRKSPLGVTHFFGERSSDYLHAFLSDHPLVAGVHVMDLNLRTVLSDPGAVDAPWPAPVLDHLETLVQHGPGEAKSTVVAVEFRDEDLLSKTVQAASDHAGRDRPPGRSAYALVLIAPVIYDVTSEIKGALAAMIPFENLAGCALDGVRGPTLLNFIKGAERIYDPSPSREKRGGEVAGEETYISSKASLEIRTARSGERIDYTLEISEPSSVWFADVDRTMKRLMLSIVGAMLLLLIFAFIVAGWLTWPLNDLIGIVNLYAGGEYAGASRVLSKTGVRFAEFRKIVNLLETMGNEITARIRGLRKAEEKYSGLLNRLNEAVYRMSLPDGKYEYISPAAEAVFGYSEKEFMDRPGLLREIIHSDSSRRMEMEWIRLTLGNAPKSFEYKIVDREGNERWIFQSNTGVFDKHGEIIALEACCTDITRRKKAVREQRRLRNLLRDIIDSMPSALVGVDTRGRVTQWNREAGKITGVDNTEAYGRDLEEVFPQIAGLMGSVREAIRKRKVKGERIVSEGDDFARFADAAVYPLLTGVDVQGAVIRVDDVTERVQMEETLIQSEKMMSVGGLAAGMAHEINNPLAGILQSAQVMRNRIRGSLPGNIRVAEQCGVAMENIEEYMRRREVFTMLESIRSSGRRASKIVTNMLTFSRGSQSMTSTHDLATLLDVSVELAQNDYDLKKSYDFRHIEILREYAPDAPRVPCEESKIQQVFFNILKNGAQAMVENMSAGRRPGDEPRGRAPKRAPPRFILRVMRERDRVRVEIEDNGPGMDASVRGRIFDPFFTTKDVGVGTGLGLSVSYFIIVENHGGEMFVESNPGKGSTFVIRLPHAKAAGIGQRSEV